MTDERARLFLTSIGAIIPLVGMSGIALIVLLAPSYIEVVALLFILAVLSGMIGHAGLTILTPAWRCAECGSRYLAYFMPYWPFDHDCQNCHLPD
jgi:hypothetical protein